MNAHPALFGVDSASSSRRTLNSSRRATYGPGGGPSRCSTLKFGQINVRMLRGEVAIAHVEWELLGDARAQNSRRGVFVFVLTRQNSVG